MTQRDERHPAAGGCPISHQVALEVSGLRRHHFMAETERHEYLGTWYSKKNWLTGRPFRCPKNGQWQRAGLPLANPTKPECEQPPSTEHKHQPEAQHTSQRPGSGECLDNAPPPGKAKIIGSFPSVSVRT